MFSLLPKWYLMGAWQPQLDAPWSGVAVNQTGPDCFCVEESNVQHVCQPQMPSAVIQVDSRSFARHSTAVLAYTNVG